MPHIPATDPSAASVGKPLARLDGRAKVTGAARYAAESPFAGTAFATAVGSTIALGTVKRIDAAEALALPGVLAVLTPLNMPPLHHGGGMFGENRLPLSDMKVNYAGQYVAVVVADTPERSRHAASLLQIEYDSREPVIHLDDPRAKTEELKESFGEPLRIERGDVKAALAQPARPNVTVVRETYTTPVETHNPMEMSATTARWERDGRLTVWDATQGVSGSRDAIAGAFGLAREKVQVLCPFVGGGFGCKGGTWAHTFLAAAAAKAAGKPVTLMLTRKQMFTGCGHRPPTEQQIEAAATSDGKLVALTHHTLMHGSKVGDHIEACGAGTSRILYDTPNFEMSHSVRRVDVATPTFMRAPGESPGTFALESAMDELAVALGIDPVELRIINHADKNPHTGQPWSSKHLKECYRVGAQRFGWAKRTPAARSMRFPDGRPMGWGMATATYPGMRFPGTARIRLYSDGRTVRAEGAAATQDLGTGTWTIGAQFTATLTGLPLERASFLLGDSALPSSGVSGGSTTAASVGQALAEAAAVLRQKLLLLAAQGGSSALVGLGPDDVVLSGGRLTSIASPARSVELAALITKSGQPFIEGVTPQGMRPGPGGAPKPASPKQMGVLEDTGEDYGANSRKYSIESFGAHFVEVVIDDPVPLVRVTRVVSVMDVGRVINPKTATSQVIGGVVMGIGMALMEETLYDPVTARPVTDNLADYPVCVNPDIHSIEAHFIDIPDTKFNAMGCRGVGEIGITGVAAAVANAVFHATGKRVRDLPITPDKLL